MPQGKMRMLLLLGALFVAPSCQEGAEIPASNGAPQPQADARLRDMAANSTFSVADVAKQPLLAVRLRITPMKVETLDAEFVRAPLPTGEGEQDLLVVGRTGERIAHQYGITDPLEAHVEEQDRGLHKTIRLEAAEVWVFMPATSLETIQILPARDDRNLPRGGSINASAVIRTLCLNVEVGACAQRALASQ